MRYDARAKLYVISNTGEDYQRGGAVHYGTLCSAVKAHMELDMSEVTKANIGVDIGTIEGEASGLINGEVIKEIYARSDFPH
ncbi:MAG: hypothetical protein DHS20C08_11610 [Rhodomicrobium sp.]|nr:MAG: hypothetical protein DHS20C08_11610 [Rhodomicrobium sp.]